MKKRIFSLFLAYAILFSCLVPALVSAEETSTITDNVYTTADGVEYKILDSSQIIIDGWTLSSSISQDHLNCLINVWSILQYNSSFESENYYIYVRPYLTGDSYIRVVFIDKRTCTTFTIDNYDFVSNYNSGFICDAVVLPYALPNYKTLNDNYVNSLLSIDFSTSNNYFSPSSSSRVYMIGQNNNLSISDNGYAWAWSFNYNNFESTYDLSFDNVYNTYSNGNLKYNYTAFFDSANSSQLPDTNETKKKNYVLYGVWVGQQIDKLDFFEWFKKENKIEYLKSCGFDLALDHISYIIDWWDEYGQNPVRVAFGLPKLISKINVISWDISLATELVNVFDNLKLEYQAYLKKDEREAIALQYPDTAHPHWHWRNPDSETDLTEDLDTDDTFISLLREILRTLIYLPENIAKFFSYIETYLDAILIDFNRLLAYMDSLPDYLATSIYNMFVEPLNMIFLALDNLEIDNSTSVEVTIPEQKQDELNVFFSDWHTTITDKLSNKFPLYTQLSELFNDEFFEKCGLDVNGDGETYSYYSSVPGSVASSASASEISAESVAINSLLKQFDNADSTYLDNIIYSEDIPDGLTVKVAGKDLAIFDFRLYAKYRYKIHAIMTLIIYTVYLLSLFKSLPTIIGNVADVSQAFSDAKAQKDDEKE